MQDEIKKIIEEHRDEMIAKANLLVDEYEQKHQTEIKNLKLQFADSIIHMNDKIVSLNKIVSSQREEIEKLRKK